VASLLIAGKLYRWDTSSGRTTAIATGQGAVRRMHFAPPASATLPFNLCTQTSLHSSKCHHAAFMPRHLASDMCMPPTASSPTHSMLARRVQD
jgi:hypothetical protein